MTDEEIEQEHIRDFFARVGDSPWFYTWDEDGSADIRTREELAKMYAEACMGGNDGTYFYQNYYGEKSFQQCKNEIISNLTHWRNEIQSGINAVRRLKKPK